LIPICRKHSLQVLGRRGRGADLCLKRFCSYSLKMSKLSKAEAASREAALALRVVKKRLLRYLPDDEDGDLSHRGGNKKTSESRIVKLVVDMDSELDMLVKAVAVLLPLLDQEDQVLHKQHLEDWAEYCEILRQQAEEVISKMKRDDQEERTIATGDDGVGDDYEAEDPDGSHEGRGARTEQAFSHTAEDAVATVVHTDHLLTADHATLEGSSEMVAVEIQDLRELAPVLVPPEDYQGLATHIGEEHNLEVEKEEVPDAASYTGQLKSQGSLQATCDDGEPVHGVTDDPKLPVLCHLGGGEVVTAIVHDPEKLFEVEEMVVKRMEELKKAMDRGAIVKLSQQEMEDYQGPVSYVAHHGVHKPDSPTTPLRVVTNTSLKNVNAKLSPNDCMQVGPNALSSLLEVLVGFRMYEVALVYDMTKAYQSIATGEVEKHVRRILWRWGDTSAPWQVLAYAVVTFGDQIAGLILELVKTMAAEMGKEIDAEASHQIARKTYVDDGAGGGSREQVERFRGELVDGYYNGTLARILALVGLKLKVMVASGDTDKEKLDLLGEKTLGHVWRPTEDKFVFRFAVNLSTTKKRGEKIEADLTTEDIQRLPERRLTKRMLLSIVMSQYDPMGLMCPIIVILKIKLRELYGPERDLEWDVPIPRDLHTEWVELITMLLQAGEIEVNRSVRPEMVEDVPELIGFADGSLLAYACCIYIRWKRVKTNLEDPDRYVVQLVCAKARVTSLKGTTAPRSELSGFLILSRLLRVVVNAMDVKPSQITLAVDSQCTISALDKSGGLLAPYFASRVSEAMINLAELGEETRVLPVQHVPGLLNPADIPTRDKTTIEEVKMESIWQRGPAYLTLPREQWPFSRQFRDTVPEEEMRAPKAEFNLAMAVPGLGDMELKDMGVTRMVEEIMYQYNSWEKSVRATARLMKGLICDDRAKIVRNLTVKDLKVARSIQFAVSMEPTIASLAKGQLSSLRPVLENGIVYTRGRIGKTLLKLMGVQKLPILDKSTRLARLIMIESHEEDHRSNPSDVMARARQRAWITGARNLAKSVCKACPVCRLRKVTMAKQLMADIPEQQLYPCPPFTHVSLDFAGPYQARAMGNSRANIKCWGLVIICQNTRAVKMLATAGYSTDDFLTCYHRFTANHGCPLLVVSDAGTQLRKAGIVIEKGDPAGLDWQRIVDGAAKSGTEWKCVEPGCQWRNGLAESAVKLVKSTLALTLASQSTLNYAELDTLFSSVANIVNQRPIAVRSFTEEDCHAITPNDLLLQRTKNTIPGVVYGTDDSITKRQEVLRELEQAWWDMWIVQALPHLVPYKKWKQEHRAMQVDDVVLVLYEKKVGKGVYKLGRVLATHPDEHGVVRTVTVGMRKSDKREKLLPYVPKPLAEIQLGIQRIAVIWPVEEQVPSDNRVQEGEDVLEPTLGEGEISPGNPEESSLTLVEPKASDHQKPIEQSETQ